MSRKFQLWMVFVLSTTVATSVGSFLILLKMYLK
jgi:hypothetical protein